MHIITFVHVNHNSNVAEISFASQWRASASIEDWHALKGLKVDKLTCTALFHFTKAFKSNLLCYICVWHRLSLISFGHVISRFWNIIEGNIILWFNKHIYQPIIPHTGQWTDMKDHWASEEVATFQKMIRKLLLGFLGWLTGTLFVFWQIYLMHFFIILTNYWALRLVIIPFILLSVLEFCL